MPKLQQAIEASAHSVAQTVPQAQVPLPEAVQILNASPDNRPQVSVSNMGDLKEEVQLLKRSLASR